MRLPDRSSGSASPRFSRQLTGAQSLQLLGRVRRRVPLNPRRLPGARESHAKEAIGHGVRAKRSKSGAISFDLLEAEGSYAAVQ